MLEPTKGRAPGQWWPATRTDGPTTATLICPDCKKPMSLQGHTIAADGTVGPSVVCPRASGNVECPECGFHEFVRLEGWNAI